MSFINELTARFMVKIVKPESMTSAGTFVLRGLTPTVF